MGATSLRKRLKVGGRHDLNVDPPPKVDLPQKKAGTLLDNAESCAEGMIGGDSFTPGTQVLLASGPAVPISLLKPADKVLAVSTKTGKTQPETVTAVLVRHDTTILYRQKSRASALVARFQGTSMGKILEYFDPAMSPIADERLINERGREILTLRSR